MKVTYKPEDGEARSWEFKPGRVRQSAAALVEKAYGKPWDQFCGEVQAGSITARRILLWHLMRGDHPVLRLEDVPDFYADEVLIEHDADELRAMIQSAETNAGIPADQRDVALGMLRAQLAEAEAAGPESSGKASSKSGR